MIDFGTDDHEYDEVQDLPKESNDQLLQSTSQSQKSNIGDSPGTSTFAGVGGSAEDSPPELPPPKQKSVKNSKNKQKQKSANKSKIPRSPSLASSFSNLASSISGINNNNNNVPPQTPPLPTSYQKPNKNKTKFMNDVEKKSVACALSGTTLAIPDLDCNSDSNLMDSSALATDGDSGTNLRISQDDPCTSGSRSQIQSPITQAHKPHTPSPASPKNFQYLTLTVRKDDNGYGMKVRIHRKSYSIYKVYIYYINK